MKKVIVAIATLCLLGSAFAYHSGKGYTILKEEIRCEPAGTECGSSEYPPPGFVQAFENKKKVSRAQHSRKPVQEK